MSDQSVRGISQKGLQFVAEREGFEPVPKPCPAGKLTVGYGHVVQPGESFPHPLSQEEALDLLRRDLAKAGAAVQRLVRAPLDDGQFAALTSFAFNVGEGALAGSTLLSKLNAGDYVGAAAEFPRWDKITVTDKVSGEKVKKPLPGLTARRQAEREMFLAALPGDGAGVA